MVDKEIYRACFDFHAERLQALTEPDFWDKTDRKTAELERRFGKEGFCSDFLLAIRIELQRERENQGLE